MTGLGFIKAPFINFVNQNCFILQQYLVDSWNHINIFQVLLQLSLIKRSEIEDEGLILQIIYELKMQTF